MKKFISVLLAALMLITILPMSALAAEGENRTTQKMEEAIKRCSKAEIRDANGKILEELELDVHVQQRTTSRSSDANEYIITCTARSKPSNWPDSDSLDGIEGTLLMVCRDEFGPSNTLISVSGGWSGEDADTYNRSVTYCYYSVSGIKSPVVKDDDAPRQFEYYPVDYKGHTFKATSEAQVTSTSRRLLLEVATDSSVLDQQ